MSIVTFGVDAGAVKAFHFPQLSSAFSPNSNPTAVTVAAMIESSAAELAGRLADEGSDAGVLFTGATAYPNAYAWCAETVRLGAAVRVGPAITGANPDVIKLWSEQLKARYKRLEDYGLSELGDAPIPAESSNGPRTHIADYNLYTGNTADISTVEPWFRRGDSK